MEESLILFAIASPLIMIVGLSFKFYQISKMPFNIRWEIYPLPLENGKRRHYGGSYLEEVDWVNKPHKKSFIKEFTEPLKEILYLHRVKEFNTYGLWLWSMALHWGIWLLFTWVILLFITLIFDNFSISKFSFIPYLSYFLGSFGSLALIIKRISNKELKLYTSGIDYLNLVFLLSIFVTGILMILSGDFIEETLSYINGVVHLNLSLSELSTFTVIHFLLFEVFLVYIPFSRFFHGPVKFFTFHKILWDDEYQKKDSPEEKRISQQLNYRVLWAGPHILPNQTWLENAKNTNLHEK
ncbi:nitrate reductase gamma subunit [Thermodesulfovibrio aggregans]|uniref:Nitrate reductase gamma subunit n=1 Tax=Thermodesulfovibrio aggregans TaxID=86166 RepID=A0A0U9HQL7_9BACT|nr:respiratory nitrate reductase subunit gamma [Thermodesulfovibrio aggregans]GAQ95108.1 nitrate reductase gamma subunit [Thermodesulfovibrio aggregans]